MGPHLRAKLQARHEERNGPAPSVTNRMKPRTHAVAGFAAEAGAYLDSVGAEAAFETMLEKLIREQPGDPEQFLIDYLERNASSFSSPATQE